MTHPKRIFVTDDDEPLRLATRDILVEAGYDVEVAVNGAELIREYRARPADLVLCDLFMPAKDGLEVIADLRREFPEAKIVAMSGGGYHGAFNVLHIARHMGAVGVLEKPFTRSRLLALVEQLLGA